MVTQTIHYPHMESNNIVYGQALNPSMLCFHPFGLCAFGFCGFTRQHWSSKILINPAPLGSALSKLHRLSWENSPLRNVEKHLVGKQNVCSSQQYLTECRARSGPHLIDTSLNSAVSSGLCQFLADSIMGNREKCMVGSFHHSKLIG